jgi:hypothetical protein
MFMYKLSKPAAAGVAIALSLVLGLGALAVRAEAMAAVAFYNWPQLLPSKVVTEERLAQIGNYDVIVFIDLSKSMSKSLIQEGRSSEGSARDLVQVVPPGICPSQTRWQWCAEQTELLTRQLHLTPQDHFKVVLFNDRYKEYKNMDLTGVPALFAGNQPSGNTNALGALRSQLREYFAARDQNKDAVKPLLLAMITDGSPDDPLAFRQLIIDATKKMQDPNEIAITFLQVGVDPKSTQYLRELDHGLVGSKARYDIVTTKSFDQVSQSGLALALLDAVHK